MNGLYFFFLTMTTNKKMYDAIMVSNGPTTLHVGESLKFVSIIRER